MGKIMGLAPKKIIMKNILGIFLSVLVLSCGAQNYIVNDNINNCTENGISKNKYNFDIQDFQQKLEEPESYQLEINTDSSKVLLMESFPNEIEKKYTLYLTSKTNKLSSVFVYDSIGRLIRKYNNHTNTKVGEEIKFKYSNAKSTTPIETYRVNYDTIYPVCWKEALQLATKKGVDPSKAEVNIVMPLKGWEPEKPMVWKIFDRKKVVHVDAYTGKVVLVGKPTPFSQY
ncbi:hypothetical protein SAMN04488096_10720 [Mesonia phycicola]|uniref:Uncharacterized protein n=2 Tax=Mesonia phycicola TaxID=579105 RepID=A0A1M6FYD1_9FLAO|nr:hypothetical protein SAMN04488096_10720 [Mesonia phycicola]